MEQLIYTQQETVEGAYVGPDGYASPWAMLRFAMNAAGVHSKIVSADRDTLTKMGMFWVVIRHRMVVSRYPKAGETVTVETWPMPTTRTAYPRAVVTYDEQGKELFRLVSLWVLVDIHKRKMVLPEKSGVTVEGILRGGELELPGKMLPQELPQETRRTVSEEDIDINQHMNNARYLSWCMDLLPRETQPMQKPNQIELCYLSESRLGQELTLNWELSADGILQVEGRRAETDVPDKMTRIFTAKLCF